MVLNLQVQQSYNNFWERNYDAYIPSDISMLFWIQQELDISIIK